ncbi:MAG: transposase [Thermoguttaceae bacterium]
MPTLDTSYCGMTLGYHNAAGKQRLGGVTKAGSPIARQVLNFAVIHVLRKDSQMKAWHNKIKARKGTMTARVTAMRKLTTIIWHMFRWDKPYQFRYEEVKPIAKKKRKKASISVGRRFSGYGNDNHGIKKSVTPLNNKEKPQVKSKA